MSAVGISVLQGGEDVKLPADALIVLLGISGSGKSHFAREHFTADEVVSSDRCRGLVSGDESDQACSKYAFEVFHSILNARLALGRRCVADATNLSSRARADLRVLAEKHGRPLVALVLDTPIEEAKRRNAMRARQVPEDVIDRQHARLLDALPLLGVEGFFRIDFIRPGESYRIQYPVFRTKALPGVDVVGDVHGTYRELLELLSTLGYREAQGWQHAMGRRLVLVGDLTDRGPGNVEVLRLAETLHARGHHIVLGNHDSRLMRALKGNPVKPAHGLAETLHQLDDEETEVSGTKERFLRLLSSLPFQVTLSVEGAADLTVCHAGMPREMVGRTDKIARNHCLYGQVQGFQDGMPLRGDDWVLSWKQGPEEPWLVHGHTVTADHKPLLYAGAHVVCVDTGAVFGGALTALRYPEMEVVSTPAARDYTAAEER